MANEIHGSNKHSSNYNVNKSLSMNQQFCKHRASFDVANICKVKCNPIELILANISNEIFHIKHHHHNTLTHLRRISRVFWGEFFPLELHQSVV